MKESQKSRESRVRRHLKKQGYRLHKSRTGGAYPNNLGGYMIVNSEYNFVVAGPNFDLSLDDVEQFALKKDQNESIDKSSRS